MIGAVVACAPAADPPAPGSVAANGSTSTFSLAITKVAEPPALSTPSQRHIVRLTPPGHAPVLLIAIERDTYDAPDPGGLHFYRSDDDGRTWRYYAPIVPGGSVHFTADLLPYGNDFVAAIGYDTTFSNFPSDSKDPQRKVLFQRWRFDGADDWSPDPTVTVAAPPSGYAYHRPVMAIDSLSRLWIAAWRRDPCASNVGSSCADTLQLFESEDGGASFTQQADLYRNTQKLGGGRLISLGTKLLMLWGDYSWADPALMRMRDDADPVGTWSPVAEAFPDNDDSIYHGSAESMVADGAGGADLVYKERHESLMYRHFDGTSFGPRTLVDANTDDRMQPALTRRGGDTYVCVNHTHSDDATEMRSFRVADGFGTWTVVGSTSTPASYPAAPDFVPADEPNIPCAYTAGDWPAITSVGVRVDSVASTPTPSPSPTSTATPTPSPTATATATPTPSPTATATPTPSPTSTATPTPSPTATATPTATPSPSPTPSATPTATPSPSPTATPSGNPPLWSLLDPFTSGPTNPPWTVERVLSGDSAVASGGVLTLKTTPSNPKAGVFVMSAKPWRLRDSSVSINLQQVVASSGIDCQMLVMNPSDRWNDQIGFWYERGVVYLLTMTDGTESDYGILKYSSTTDAWLRLRETAGTIYWETSADGQTWTTQASAPDSAAPQVPLDGVVLDFHVKEYASGNSSPGAMKIAHLNGG